MQAQAFAQGPVSTEAEVIDEATRRCFFEAEVQRLLDRMFGTALRLTRNRADAEDLVGETVAKAWASLAELRDLCTFEAWIRRILANTFISGFVSRLRISYLTFKEHSMKKLMTLAAMAAAFGAFGSTVALAQAHGDHLMVVPAELKWADVGSLPPGAQLAVIEGPLNEAKPFTFRLKLPANYQIPAHFHSAIEHVTVISGTFNMGAGDKLDTKATRALTAGSAAIMQPGTRHFAWTADETVVQVHGVGPWTITYVNPADDPRKK